MSENYLPGKGPMGAKLMILGDAPTGGTHFGKTELASMCRDAGFNVNDAWHTTVSKYPVMPNPKEGRKIPFNIRAKNSGVDVDQSLRELQQEINDVAPNCILGLSSAALWALAGKSNIGYERGSINLGMGRKFVVTYHPRDLGHQSGGEIKGYWNKQVMTFDFKRAYDQSRFPDIRRPQRNLQICRDSGQFHDFITRNADRRRLSVDIEAGGHCLPICVGLSFQAHEGLTIPLWNCEGISQIPDSDMVTIWKMLARLLYEKDIVGQNFNYDRDKIRRLGFIIKTLISDTMLKAFCINPELPKRLSFNTSIYTEEPFYKDEGMYEGRIEDLLLGCARDACVTLEVDEKMDPDLDELGLRPFYQNFLMRLPEFYAGIEQQGFRVNEEFRDQLIAKYVKWDERLRYELFSLVGDEVNVQSPKQVSLLLWENLKLPRKRGTGEEELTKLLKSPKLKDSDRHIIGLILEDRRVRKTIGTYLMALPDYDGRIRTTYFPCLETGRSSSGQQDPPIRPIIEIRDENNKKKKKVLGTAFQTITKHGDIGEDVRKQFIPDEPDEESGPEGYDFLQADSSQAEARVIAVLAGDEDMLRLYDEHDVHALTASWFFGGTESDYSKKILGYESPIRFAGKTLRHAGHLGAGKSRAATELNTQARKYKIDISITEATAQRALNIFHSKSPSIQKVFHKEVIEALQNNKRKLVAPLPYGIDAPTGGIRTFFERWGNDLFRQAFSYIPQRAVSDNTKAAGLRIKERIPSIRIVMEAHDGLLFCVPKIKLHSWGQIIKEEMERPIDFSQCSLPRGQLSIPCDVEVGPNYMELNKFQLKAA